MKKMVMAILVVVLAGGFLVVGDKRAEAMNNESAALLAGAIAVLGPPLLYGMSGAYRPGPAYAASYPVRTEVVYEYRSHARNERYCEKRRAYDRGLHDGVRQGYLRGRYDGGRRY
jgi:hypothetical protein